MNGPPSGPNRIFLISRTRAALKADLPPELIGRYYIDGRSRPGLGFFHDRRARQPVIRDLGRALDTWRTDPATVSDMLKIAQHRGWVSLQVQGELAFRRAVWGQAQALGLDVRGYQPTERDVQTNPVIGRPAAAPAPRAPLSERTDRAGQRFAVLRVAETLAAARIADRTLQGSLLMALRERAQMARATPARSPEQVRGKTPREIDRER